MKAQRSVITYENVNTQETGRHSVVWCNHCSYGWRRDEDLRVHVLIAHPESDDATEELLSREPLRVRAPL